MWKYRCKSHLLSLIGSFLVGVLFGLIANLVYGGELQVYMRDILADAGVPAAAIPSLEAYIESPLLQSLSLGIVFAGLINIVLLAQYFSSVSTFSPLIFIVLLMFASTLLLFVGIILLLPSVIACIYGMLTLRSSLASQRKQRNISNDDV